VQPAGSRPHPRVACSDGFLVGWEVGTAGCMGARPE
jgi:hypothetical protein